ncbi:hypothetical protein A6E05_13675 [Aliivibrio sp. 1S165]|uniref:hypothetical protein n=1 Tax=unclassified Aliivibrio TaxID=2645654 RepID=UPI00080D9541|nr:MULTISPECIES: hypothetical protein [unclassified Aliivibrio]OCH17747.1 hypothetical protein A6E05_13675 [Aliivibrio sp. 1S165]OCH29010.1 hypothetical protein A6E06_19385 [Aliivibrio sp. 1S175]
MNKQIIMSITIGLTIALSGCGSNYSEIKTDKVALKKMLGIVLNASMEISVSNEDYLNKRDITAELDRTQMTTKRPSLLKEKRFQNTWVEVGETTYILNPNIGYFTITLFDTPDGFNKSRDYNIYQCDEEKGECMLESSYNSFDIYKFNP